VIPRGWLSQAAGLHPLGQRLLCLNPGSERAGALAAEFRPSPAPIHIGWTVQLAPGAGQAACQNSAVRADSWVRLRPAVVVGLSAWVAFRLVTALVAARGGGGLVTPWEQWDGNWYINIARQGYVPLSPMVDRFGQQFDATVFMPFYPGLIAAVSRIPLLAPPVAALLISSAALLLAIVALYRLTEIDYGRRGALVAIVLLLAFPSSMFLVAPYTESLLLLFGVTAFLAARYERWWLAGIMAALALITKAYMIVLVAALLVEYLQARQWSLSRVRSDVAWLVVPPALAIAGWMTYLGLQVHDPVRFLTAERLWGHQFAPPWVALAHASTMLVQHRLAGIEDLTSLVLLFAISAFTLLRVRISYGVMLLLAAFSFSAVTVLTSTNRYMVVLFPMFIAAARWLSRRLWLAGAVAVASAPLVVILLLRYTSGQWAG
jgi:hypothetical protein